MIENVMSAGKDLSVVTPSRSRPRDRFLPQFRAILAGVAIVGGLFLNPLLAHAGGVTPGAGTATAPFNGTFPWLVIRCHASDETAEPQTTSYFQQMFTVSGAGTMNMFDWWHDVSFGQISIAGTTVAAGKSADSAGWYSLSIKQAAYDALSRQAQVQACADLATPDYNLANYYGVITIFPATDTGALPGGNADGYGPISNKFAGVNGKGGGTFTLGLVNLPSNANETFAGHEMGHSFGLHHSRLLSTPTQGYGDGFDIMSAMGVFSLTPPASDPKDAVYGGSNVQSGVGVKGPGPDAITLDDEGWIPLNRIGADGIDLPEVISLHALSDPAALTDTPLVSTAGPNGGLLETRVPAKVSFPFSAPPPTCNSAYYTLEYREPIRWDAGLPRPASYWNPASPAQLNEINDAAFPTGSVLLHLICVSSWNPPPPSYGFSLLVDTEPAGGGHSVGHNVHFYSSGAPAGAYYPGDEYADDASKFYFAVNGMSNASHDATIAIAVGSGKINDALKFTGPVIASKAGPLAASALLTTNEPTPLVNAVVPGHVVTFKLGTNSCTAVTDLNGIASCTLQANGPLFSKPLLTVTTPATLAYVAARATASITIEPPPPQPLPTKVPLRAPQVHEQIHRPLPPKRLQGSGV